MSDGGDHAQAELYRVVMKYAPVNTAGLCLDAVRSGMSADELVASGAVPDALLLARNRQEAYASYQRLRADRWAADYTLELWDGAKAKGLWTSTREPEDALVSKLFALRAEGCGSCCGDSGDFLALPDYWQWHDQNIRLRGVPPVASAAVGDRFSAHSIACAARRLAAHGLVINPSKLAFSADGCLHWSSLRLEGRPGGARCSRRTQRAVLALLLSRSHPIAADLHDALADGSLCIADLPALLDGQTAAAH
jgi:hypothetical protein